MAHREILEGKTFGDFVVTSYLGSKRYELTCNICGEKRELLATNIKKTIGVTCKTKQEPVLDLEGSIIGEWEVLKYLGNKKYLCRCSCNKLKEVLKVNLVNGSSTSCGHNHNSYGDLTGQTFGEWTVIRKEGNRWLCQCSCEKFGYASARDLVTHKTTSCGHSYNEFYDITGKKYGLWEVLKYDGNGYYTCRCSCEDHTIRSIRKQDLIRETSTSCGCNKLTKSKQTLLDRYGEIGPNKVCNPRDTQQIEAIISKDNMQKFIESLGYTPTSMQLADELGMQLHRTLIYLHRFNLFDLIDLLHNKSNGELEIFNFVKETTDEEVITGDRKILNGKELDIYIPSLKLAIEFNDTYWHSSLLKDRCYHQQKTIDCAKQGVRLIHIFEYEWNNNCKQTKIKELLKRIITKTKYKIYAKQLSVKSIDNKESTQFVEKYHLQGSINSSINIGAYYDNMLVGVMTFGKPRFENTHEFELYRLCWKTDINVVGGTDKLFKHFIRAYSPESIATYSDIGKFTGNVYTRLGFKPLDKPISEPNYVWVSADGETVLSRYQTQKHKILLTSKDKEIYKDMSENDIMNSLGYLKVYDSGNLRLEWKKCNQGHD